MAIIERKQLTGTTEQINAYAGHNGQLAFDKTTKHLHVLSGTAGTTTKLANADDIPAPVDISGKADKAEVSLKADITYVDEQLATKQPTGDYATNTALTTGLAGKANAEHSHAIADVSGLQAALDGKLDTTGNISYSQITDAPSIPDTSGLIPKTGDGGKISVYESMVALSSGDTISVDSPSTLVVNLNTSSAATLKLNKGLTNKASTKLLYIFNASSVTFTPASGLALTWLSGTAPTFKKHNLIVLAFHNADKVFANLVSAWD